MSADRPGSRLKSSNLKGNKLTIILVVSWPPITVFLSVTVACKGCMGLWFWRWQRLSKPKEALTAFGFYHAGCMKHDTLHAGQSTAWIKCGRHHASAGVVTNQNAEVSFKCWHTFPAAILSSVNSPNHFHLLPKLSLNFTSFIFRCNSNWLRITSTGVSEIVENPYLLRVNLAQPWLACLSKWAIHGSCPGHHATGLLLETWTLGNVGINSRSLYD